MSFAVYVLYRYILQRKMTKPSAPEIEALYQQAEQTRTAAAWITLGDAFALWHSLYYACEGIKGVCQFLRQDIDIEIEVVNKLANVVSPIIRDEKGSETVLRIIVDVAGLLGVKKLGQSFRQGFVV